MVITQCYITI